MACGLGSSSWFNPNSTQPAFTSSYTLGSRTNITWWGNIAPVNNQVQQWKLVLAWASDTNLTNAESLGHTSEVTEHEPPWIFRYGTVENPSWNIYFPDLAHSNGDSCGDTVLGVWWNINPNIDISSNNKFKIYGLNMTDGGNVSTVTSPGFLLLPSEAPSASSSSTPAQVTTARSSTSISSSVSSTLSNEPTIRNEPAATGSAPAKTAPSGLSTGEKAGISVGFILFACLSLVGVWFFVRQRRQLKAYEQASSATVPRGPVKPVADQPSYDLDGAQIHELRWQHRSAEMEERRRTPLEMDVR